MRRLSIFNMFSTRGVLTRPKNVTVQDRGMLSRPTNVTVQAGGVLTRPRDVLDV